MESSLEKRLGEIIIRTYVGDITELTTDAVVNAANSDLWMGSGVAGAIKARGGIEIEREAISLGPIRPGESVITTGGRLPAKYVIHCAGMPPGGRATQRNVTSSVRQALEIASEYNLKSIAFPAIGAGVGGLGEYDAARAILAGISQYTHSPKSVREITLVGLRKHVCDSFWKAFDEYQE